MTCLISLAIVLLISAVLLSAEILFALRICKEPVVTQCQCGMGRILEDVYVEGCQVVSNETRPCQPCPGACQVFQNCKTCSKYDCLSCPDGKTGKFCEVVESFQTTNPNKDIIQNVSDVLIQNVENITLHDSITDADQTGKIQDINLNTNESVILMFEVKQSKNSTLEHGSEPNKDIKLDSLDLISKNFSDFQNDTESNLNKTAQILQNLPKDNNAMVPDIPGICTSNCSTVETNETIANILSESPGSVGDENLHLDESVNASVENEESIEDEPYLFKNADSIEKAIEFSDYRDNAPFNLSLRDTVGEGGNGTNINDEFLKHRSPNPSLDKDTIAETNETENAEQIEAIESNENPTGPIMKSSLPKSNNNMGAETRYISVHTYDMPDYQDYPKEHEDTKEDISSSERDIKNDYYADKTSEDATNPKVLDQIYEFSKPPSLRQYRYDKEGEEYKIQTSFPNWWKNLCASVPSTFICRTHSSTVAPLLPRLDSHSHINYFQSPSFTENEFLFPKTKFEPYFEYRREPNDKPRSEEILNPNQEHFDTIHKISQQTQDKIAQRTQPSKTDYYILETNQNPLSLKSTVVNAKLNLQKAKFPSLIDHLLQLVGHHITPNQEKSYSGINGFISEKVSGDIFPENVENPDAPSPKLKFLNLFPQAPGQKSAAVNINSEFSSRSQNPFKKQFSPDQNKLPVVKGQIIVLQLGNTNGTLSGLVPEVVRSRNFELEIPFLTNNSDKKESHNLKSERKKHGKGSKHSRKLKRHRLKEGGQKKCNPWKEDCTKHHSTGSDAYKSSSSRKMKLTDSLKIGKKSLNRPDRIHIKFMQMDDSPSTILNLKNYSHESSGLNDNVNQSNPYENIMKHNSTGSKFSFSCRYLEGRKIDDPTKSDSSSIRLLSRRKRSTNNFCPIPKETRHGDLDCTIWSYKKVCKLICHDGYTSSHLQFSCMRSKNSWVPSLTSCIGQPYNEPSNHMQPFEDGTDVDNGAEYADNESDDNEEMVKVEDNDGETDADEEFDEGHAHGKKHPKGNHVRKKVSKAHVNSIHMHEESHEGDEDMVKIHKKGHVHPKKPKHKGRAPMKEHVIRESEDDEDAVIPNNEEAEEVEIPNQNIEYDYQNDEVEEDAEEDSVNDEDYDESERKK